MRLPIWPYITTGVAIIGATVVVATPVTLPPIQDSRTIEIAHLAAADPAGELRDLLESANPEALLNGDLEDLLNGLPAAAAAPGGSGPLQGIIDRLITEIQAAQSVVNALIADLEQTPPEDHVQEVVKFVIDRLKAEIQAVQGVVNALIADLEQTPPQEHLLEVVKFVIELLTTGQTPTATVTAAVAAAPGASGPLQGIIDRLITEIQAVKGIVNALIADLEQTPPQDHVQEVVRFVIELLTTGQIPTVTAAAVAAADATESPAPLQRFLDALIKSVEVEKLQVDGLIAHLEQTPEDDQLLEVGKFVLGQLVSGNVLVADPTWAALGDVLPAPLGGNGGFIGSPGFLGIVVGDPDATGAPVGLRGSAVSWVVHAGILQDELPGLLEDLKAGKVEQVARTIGARALEVGVLGTTLPGPLDPPGVLKPAIKALRDNVPPPVGDDEDHHGLIQRADDAVTDAAQKLHDDLTDPPATASLAATSKSSKPDVDTTKGNKFTPANNGDDPDAGARKAIKNVSDGVSDSVKKFGDTVKKFTGAGQDGDSNADSAPCGD